MKFVPKFGETPLTFYWQTGMPDVESQEISPTITYSEPGTYKITLVVLYNNSLREVSKTITIHGSPVMEIKSSRNFICQPGDVVFSLQSGSDLKTTTWDFGDGQLQNYPDGNLPVTYNFSNFGEYLIKVSTEDNKGCKGNTALEYSVRKPGAALSYTSESGCVPVEVLFKAAVDIPEGSTVTDYNWDFSDGTPPITTTVNEVKHIFNRAETFVPSLSITTSEGCTNSFQYDPITVTTPIPIPILSVNKPIGCASEKMYFTASGNGATKFFWSIEKASLYSGMPVISTADSVLVHEFEALGDFLVSVVAEKDGCRSENAIPVSVTLVGVVAEFSFTNSCEGKNRFNFRNTSEGVVNRVQWTFIDSDNRSGQSRPSFTFPKQGSFPVTMIVTENASGCSDTANATMYTALPELLPAETFVCLGSVYNHGVANTYTSPQTNYSWTLAGRNFPGIADSNFSAVPDRAGLFTNRVIISNGTGYCRDTLIQPGILKVSGPTASFESPAQVCQSSLVQPFDRTVTAFTENPVVAWRWDFGNGVTDSGRQPKAVPYSSQGTYNLSLEVEDIDGCKNVLTKKIRVTRLPLLRIVPRSQKICEGQDVALKALNKGKLLWSNPGTAGCDTCSVINLRPMVPTLIHARATDVNGCVSRDSILVDVWPSFELPAGAIRDTSICTGNIVPLNLNIKDKVITWFPESGLSSSVIPNPVAKPDSTTLYTAVVKDLGGCFTRTANVNIEVNPIPTVGLEPEWVLPYNTPFTIKPVYSGTIASYSWQPANLLTCSRCAEPSGVATVSTLFTVNVVSDKGCKSSGSIRLSLDCSEKNLLMPNAFTPNQDGLNDIYYPLTRSISIVRRFAIYNRLGELVFENKNFKPNDKSQGWNGTYKGKEQPTGSFIFFLDAECELGNSLSTKGSITLIR